MAGESNVSGVDEHASQPSRTGQHTLVGTACEALHCSLLPHKEVSRCPARRQSDGRRRMRRCPPWCPCRSCRGHRNGSFAPRASAQLSQTGFSPAAASQTSKGFRQLKRSLLQGAVAFHLGIAATGTEPIHQQRPFRASVARTTIVRHFPTDWPIWAHRNDWLLNSQLKLRRARDGKPGTAISTSASVSSWKRGRWYGRAREGGLRAGSVCARGTPQRAGAAQPSQVVSRARGMSRRRDKAFCTRNTYTLYSPRTASGA
eukprot:6172946-Pleurochrysis_carterae.AAC.2